MFEIDWTTEEDRMRRRPKASTIHGWLRMWRGTFAGNERVRQQGRYEMKVARALRAHDAKKSAADGGNGGPFSLLRLGSLSNRRNAQAPPGPQPQRQKSSGSRHHRSGSQSHQKSPRPVPTKRKSSSNSSGANKGRHPSRHGSRSHARPEPTHQHSSHSARRKPSRQSSGRR